jgi:phosphatidylserine/phosphatidylglycerophosphate/cardiolipin synthase-like enzyme
MPSNNRVIILSIAIVLSFSCPAAWAKRNPHHATAAGQHAPPAATLSLSGADATVAFSPNGDATKVIVMAIASAKKQILVQAYGFTSPAIITALGRAKARGVDVEVILDKINKSVRYSGANYLKSRNIPVWIDDSVAIAHNKIMVIDNDSVISGSFNFTRSAQQKNAENVLIISHAPALARLYARNWTWRKSVSHGDN